MHYHLLIVIIEYQARAFPLNKGSTLCKTFLIKPLLNLPFNKLFWSIGNVLDGYYLRKGMSYKLKMKEFITSALHFLTNYRNSRKLSKDRRNSTNSLEQESA